MIYFDNAATGGFKPQATYDAVNTVIRYLSANPGRSGHRLSVTGAKTVYSCREVLADFFGGNPDRVVFTKNCTEALNLAILGTVKKGDRVICTVFEHNSVLRPLKTLENAGIIELCIVGPENGRGVAEKIKENLNKNTALIVMTAVSNVTGEELPVKEVGKIATENNIKFIVDGAQGGGHIPLSLSDGISALALAGHKGLCGIMGSGVLIFDDETDIAPLMTGGTGNESFNLLQPLGYPERLESGTLNLPAIAGLNEGVRFVKNNIVNFGEQLYAFTEKLIDSLSETKGITVYSKPNRSGIVSFAVSNIESTQVADTLNSKYDIAVRGGLHCSPLTHKFLKTQDDGLVRVSLAVQNSSREINYFIRAIKEIAES